MDEEIIQWNVSMYNQCIYFTLKKHQTNIYYMKHTKIYQARIQRTFINYYDVSCISWIEWIWQVTRIRKYATNDHTSTKNYKNPAALIKDSILWIKTTTTKSQKLEFNEYWWHYFLWINSTTKSTKIKNKRVLMKPKIYIW